MRKFVNIKTIKIKSSNITLWEPFRSQIKTNLGNWDLENLKDVEEIDMTDLIKTVNSITPVTLNTNIWDTLKQWSVTLLAAIMVCIVTVFICLKYKNCIVARALLRRRRGNAKPDTEVEARPLLGRSQDASPVDAEVEKPEGGLESSLRLMS